MSKIAPINVMTAITVISLGLGVCNLYTYRLERIVYVSNGISIVVYQIIRESSNLVMLYWSFVYVFVFNYIFLAILIIVNIILYVELRKIIKRKQRLLNNRYIVFFFANKLY